MLRGYEGEFALLAQREEVPPIELMQLPDPERLDDAAIAGCDEHDRIEPVPEPHQGRDIQMVIVVVAEEDDVDQRQRLPCDARITNPLRPRPANRTCPFRPDRVGQDGDDFDSNEEGCMIDEGDCNVVAVKWLGKRWNAFVLDSIWPAAAAFAKHSQDRQDCWRTPPRQGWIDEPLSIEMI